MRLRADRPDGRWQRGHRLWTHAVLAFRASGLRAAGRMA
jgi:hypothetical protein